MILMALISLVSSPWAKAGESKSPGPKDMKILFIGNSYTNGIQKVYREMLTNAGYDNSNYTFLWGGGASLERLIENGRAFRLIAKRKWDIVILQEQSMMPALEGEPKESFKKSLGILVEKIRGIGAEPMLYMTWGRRDGAGQFKEQLPNYTVMQKKLSESYQEMGAFYKIKVVPVGDAWAEVLEADKDLGHDLFQDDGSHPSAKGSYLAASLFLRYLYNDPLKNLGIPTTMTEDECNIITKIVQSYKLPE